MPRCPHCNEVIKPEQGEVVIIDDCDSATPTPLPEGVDIESRDDLYRYLQESLDRMVQALGDHMTTIHDKNRWHVHIKEQGEQIYEGPIAMAFAAIVYWVERDF